METFEPDPAMDVDSINNLDTAKRTLRWALEKLRSQEKEMSALKEEIARRGSKVERRQGTPTPPELEQEREELRKDQEAVQKTAEQLKDYEARLARSWQEKRATLDALREKILKEIENAKGGGAA